MLITLVLGLVVLSLIALAFSLARALLHNLAQAKASGFKYLVVPFLPFSLPWTLLQPVVLPLLDRLPLSWTHPWLPITVFGRAWHHGYKPFGDLDADTVMVVSPGGNLLLTCEPEATHHFLRDNTFGKPHELMSVLNLFGPTMTSVEDTEARLYRKMTAPFFNERTMNQVWLKAVAGAGSLTQIINGRHEEVRPILARLTLYVLNAVCFEDKEDCLTVLRDSGYGPSDHELTYNAAMGATLEHLITIFFTPSPILEYSPLPMHRDARQAYRELRRYMEELCEIKNDKSPGDSTAMEPSFIDLLLQTREDLTHGSNRLPAPAVLGNIFFLMFAGHESSALTLDFLIILLACHPEFQVALQSDLDRIIGDTAPSEWSFEKHYRPLSTGYVGAIINETSRLFTVLPYLSKTSPSIPQPITLADKNYIIPAETVIFINTSAVHRHPSFWPASPIENPIDAENAPNAVASFNPEHWLQSSVTEGGEQMTDNFLRPQPGCFIPFSEGHRGCLGKRFALVELVAIVSRIFKDYSVELVVDCDANAPRRKYMQCWRQARKEAEHAMSAGAEFKISLRRTRKIPLRFVRRT